VEIPKSILEAAQKLLVERVGRDFVIVQTATDTHPQTRSPIHLVAAVPAGKPNARPVEIILDEAGRSLELTARAASFLPVIATVPPDIFAPVRVTINPATNDLRLGECDKLTETITVTIPKSAAMLKADVYFLADNTGSMGPVINAVKAGANNILGALAGSGIDLHYGVGAYHDFADFPGSPGSVFQPILALTGNAALVPPAFNTWTAALGGDGPEAQFLALDHIAQPPGGSIGWRAGAKHIVVWFGDAPGHDPICKAISGLGFDITEASVTAKLQANNITVLAINTTTGFPQALDDDPTLFNFDYGVCGVPGGTPGQAKRITVATGGIDVTGINPAQIVQTIINQVIVLLGIQNVHLQPVGAIVPFVTSITPASYGPLDPLKDNVLKFQVTLSGGATDCTTRDQVFTGAIDVVADGTVVAAKPTRITVPACKYTYGVKFVCGVQREWSPDGGCAPVRPGAYATEINILNPKCKPANVLKRFIPVVLKNEPIGREPRVVEEHATDKIVIPPGAATMDDCCRIGELLKLGGAPSLNIGFLEIISDQELHVTAVYTATDLKNNGLSMDVVIVPAKLT